MLSSKTYFKSSCLLSISALITTNTTVLAQETETNDKIEHERIVVTGSRIHRTDMETSTPIIEFNASQIQRMGVSSISEFLRENAATGGFNESSTLSQAAGSSSVGLKGFGSEYTLILLNGRRLPKNSAGGIFTDINQIPMAAVERIEILPDGASAVYGSDAVAGVINIITKKDFEGVAFTAKYGAAIQSSGLNVRNIDGNETQITIVAGINSDKANALFTAEHLSREPIEAVDRELGRTATIKGHEGGEGRSSWGIPGFTTINSTFDQNGQRRDNAAKGQGSTPWSNCPDEQIFNGRCLYDFAPYYQLQPKTERQSIFSSLNYEVNNALSIDGQFRFTRAYTLTSNAPAPGQVDVSNSPFLEEFLRNDRYKNNPELAEKIINLIQNGEASVTVGRRYIDFPNREKDNTNETFEAVGGLEYQINDDWALDFDFGHSRLTNRQIGRAGQLLASEVASAFNSASSKLNPFIINDCYSQELADICKELQASTHRTGMYQVSFGSLVATGLTPLKLYGGEVGVALGIDLRSEKYSDRSDPASIAGQVIGGAGSNGSGTFRNTAAFIELSLPILDDVELNLAARNDAADWELSDATKTTYSAKVAYKPVDELLLRASYGTGFKAPNLSNLFTAESSGVRFGVDTKRCKQFGGFECNRVELNSKGGGNSELKPETSKSYNLGAVYELLDNLSLSLDYWSLQIDDVIGSLSLQEILDEEAAGRLTHLVTRNSEGKLTDTAREGFVRSNLQNLTERSATGILYNINYDREFSFGEIRTRLKAEQFLTYKQQNSAVQPLCDSISDNSMRKFNINAGLTYLIDELETSLNIRYLPGYDKYDKRNTVGKTCELIGYYEADVKDGKVITTGRPQSIASFTQVDWNAGYYLNNFNKVSLGIRNIFNKQPSFSTPNNWPFYDQSTYNNIGRFFYAQYELKF